MCKYTLFHSFATAMLAILVFFPISSTEARGTPIYILDADSPVRLQLKRDELGRIQFEKLMRLFEFFSELSNDGKLNECPERCFNYVPSFVTLDFLHFTPPPPARPFNEERSRIFSEKGINLGKFNQSFVQDARKTIREGRAAIFRAFKFSTQLKKLYKEHPNWKKGPFEVKGWNWLENGQTCTLDRTGAIIINGSFYLVSEMLSHSFGRDVKFPESQGILEFINRDLNSSLLMNHLLYEYHNRDGRVPYVNGTTILTGFSRFTWLSIGKPLNFDTHPAVQEAYHKNRQNVNLALDAVTPSNIAVLALPMVMNLVPVAVLEDLKTWTIILYIIFTDIFSCIPFIIKGIELLIVAVNENKDYLVVDQDGSMEKGFIEIYVASCSELKDFQYGGIVFIIVGVLVTIFGVGLELLALYLVKRRKIKKLTDVDGIFGLSFYLEKSELGIWRNDINERIEEMQLVEGMKRYSEELSYSDEDLSVTGDNGWKAWWMK